MADGVNEQDQSQGTQDQAQDTQPRPAREVVIDHVAEGVLELRSVEAGNQPERDLAKLARESLAVIDAVKDEDLHAELAQLRPPLAALTDKDATAASVLDALQPDDRAEVELLVEAFEAQGGEGEEGEGENVGDAGGLLDSRLARAWAKVQKVVAEGAPLEAADAAARQAAATLREKRPGIRARIEKAEKDLRKLEEAERVARRQYQRMALADRSREGRQAAAIAELREAAARAGVSESDGPEAAVVCRTLAALDAGQSVSTAMLDEARAASQDQ